MSASIEEVVRAGLCVGCGACTSEAGTASPMRLTPEGTLVPSTVDVDALAVARCPSVSLHLVATEAPVHAEWGPLLKTRTGWASDPEVRYRGSSGGCISAVLIHLLESGQADFVAHVAAASDDPLRNDRQISRSRADVLRGAGSRYAPSSPLAHLDHLFRSGERFAFVGKPCDVAALRAYLQQHPDRREQLVAAISFMCAGVPTLTGTHAVLRALGTQAQEVRSFQYRGNGWPGFATAITRDGRELKMDYNRSWGEILGPHLQLRCKLCPDGTGEFADLVCADAWYGKDGYPDFQEREGRSLVLSRTATGEALVGSAVAAGALVLETVEEQAIGAMQPYQLTRKRVVLGRWLAVGLRRGVWPSFEGLHLWRAQRRGSLLATARNAWGTFRRLGRIQGR